MDSDIAIRAENISKTFRIPHEKVNTLRGAFVNALNSKTYEKFRALDNVSFEVKKGEFFGIIGRNGSGKSTLLKILAGIYQADRGKVKINGLISPFLELGIGFNPELSGRDNIYLNATVLGLSKKQIDKKFDDIVEFSELRRFIDQKLKNYSSGMQVRLAFSVAIHANRDILLMDEVLAVGDANFQYKCTSEFNKHRSMGKTVILVTHDILNVQKYCDRAMLLRNGKISMIGDPQKVGNEYIYQNMTDEEKRLLREEEQRRINLKIEMKKRINSEDREKKVNVEKNPDRWGSRDVIIKKTEIFSNDYKLKKLFNHFDDIVIRIFYDNKSGIKEAVFGIDLHKETGHCLFAVHSKMLEEKIMIGKEGYFDFILEKVPLRNGVYCVTSGIANESATIQYDYWKDAATFTVMSDRLEKQYLGDINVKFKFKVSNHK